MKLRLKKLKYQVIVITGASSGIGLATARRAARRGARVVLAARSEADLQQLAEEINHEGPGQAIAVAADVGNEGDVQRVAEAALREFGGFDTWVNNAGASVYGRATDVSVEDMRRVFDTNFWGVVHGSRVALRYLREHGGALINVGSETSDVAVPLQAIYSASKQAVKGWTDAIRLELEYEKAPVSVTLIKPGPIDTPYTEHAANYMADQPQHAPPVYDPESVAEAILHAATTPVRDLYVGGGAKAMATLEKMAPRLADKIVENTIYPATHSGRPRHGRDALHEAGGGLRERGDYPGIVRRSMYTRLAMHPALTAVAAVGAGVLFASLWSPAPARAPGRVRRSRADRRPGYPIESETDVPVNRP
jgi:short-subunit dehydrogenase